MWTDTDKMNIQQERPEPVAPEEKISFEDVLEIVGSYGKYQQIFLWLFVVPISIVTAFLNMNQIFLLSTPNHWCYEPTVFSDEQLTIDEKRTLVNPPSIDPDGTSPSDSCQLYDLNYTSVLEDLNNSGMNVSSYVTKYCSNWSIVPCKYGWEFDKTFYRKTATTDWNLVCDDDYLPSLVFTLVTVGAAVGTPIYGTMCDRFGRKPITFAIIIIAIVSSALTVLSPWFYGFAIAQGVCGSVYPTLCQSPLLIVLEMVSPDGRGRANAIGCFGWTAGLVAVPLVAWLTADWLFFGWICAAITFPFLVCFWFLPESPRWLLTQGRLDEANTVLQRIAKVNGKDISNIDMTSILENCSFNEENQDYEESNVSVFEFLKHPTLFRRLMFLTMSWTAMTISYTGFHLNLKTLYGNEFLSFFLLSMAEAVSYILAWFMMESRLGRRWSNVLFLLVTAIVCILPIMIPKDAETYSTLASVVGTFGVAGSSMVLIQQSAEIFPTTLRASGLGISETLANVISICAPYIVYLSIYGYYIPYTVMSVVCLLAGLCATFVPETLYENLPQTIEDGETFGRNRPFITLAKKKERSFVEKTSNREKSTEAETIF